MPNVAVCRKCNKNTSGATEAYIFIIILFGKEMQEKLEKKEEIERIFGQH